MNRRLVIFVVGLLAWVSGLAYQAVELENLPPTFRDVKMPWMDDNFAYVGDEDAFQELEHMGMSHLMNGKLVCSCDQCHCGNKTEKLVQVKQPVINGCGPEFLPTSIVKYLNVFHFKKCCDRHDACYGDCGSSRTECDGNFQKCLVDSCSAEEEVTLCKNVAEIYYYAVRAAGCYAAFIPTQQDLCRCQ